MHQKAVISNDNVAQSFARRLATFIIAANNHFLRENLGLKPKKDAPASLQQVRIL
jgi:hypothetical protein